MTFATLLALVGLFVIAPSESCGDSKREEFQPHDEIQAAIRVFLQATSKETRQKALDKLRKVRRQKLIPQLVYFSSRAKGVREGMAAGVIAASLRIRDAEIVAALIAHLSARDKAFRKSVRSLIMDLESGLRLPTRTFPNLYQAIEAKARQGQRPAEALVMFIYTASPGAALINMKSAYLGKEPAQHRRLVWAEHVVSDALWKKTHRFDEAFQKVTSQARQELDGLSIHPAWWVRLYVAAIIKQHPELGSKELVQRLKMDRDDLVRKTLRTP